MTRRTFKQPDLELPFGYCSGAVENRGRRQRGAERAGKKTKNCFWTTACAYCTGSGLRTRVWPADGHWSPPRILSTFVSHSHFVNCVTDLEKVEDDDMGVDSNAANRNRRIKKLGALLGPLVWDQVSQEESRTEPKWACPLLEARKCERAPIGALFLSPAKNQSQER